MTGLLERLDVAVPAAECQHEQHGREACDRRVDGDEKRLNPQCCEDQTEEPVVSGKDSQGVEIINCSRFVAK